MWCLPQKKVYTWDVCDDNPKHKDKKAKRIASYDKTKRNKQEHKGESIEQLKAQLATQRAFNQLHKEQLQKIGSSHSASPAQTTLQ